MLVMRRPQVCSIDQHLDLEVQAHSWIQFSVDESKILEVQAYVTKDTGYHYRISGVDIVKYHVDNVWKIPYVRSEWQQPKCQKVSR